MSEHRTVLARVAASLVSRRRRWVTGAISAIGVSGLVLGSLAGPASALDLPNNVSLDQWADVAVGWVNGDLHASGAGASAYEEGQTVPFRLDVTSAGAGTFDFSVCRDYANGAVRGYLSLEPYTTSRNPLIAVGATVTDAAGGSSQPFTGAAIVGGVHIDDVTEVGGPGACGALQRETQVRITISQGPGGLAPVGAYVLWGGRLASPADAGVGPAHGASEFPGGSLSMRLASSAKNRSIKTDAIIQLGTITVQKVVDSGTATADQFCFTISPNPSGVILPQCPASGQSTVSFVALPTGSYTVTEVGLNGYSFASGTGSTANCGITAGVATASVAEGNTPVNATCVFHNRRQTGTLTINQVIDPSDDPGRFNLQIDGTTAGTGANVGDGGTTGQITVSSGAHGVGQTAGTNTDLGDYTASVSCTDGTNPVAYNDGNVTVADGQNVVCTITLTPAPIIIVDPPTTTTTIEEPTTTTTVAEPTTTTTVAEPTTTTTVAEPTTTTTVAEPTTTTTVAVQEEPTTTTTVAIQEADPTTTTTTSPVVDPTSDDGGPRCASNRTKPQNGNCGDPIVDPQVEGTTTTTAAPVADPGVTVAGGGEQAGPAPEQVLGGELERTAPSPTDTNMAPVGGSLPRTGSGIGTEVTLAFGLLGAGLAILRLVRRRRPASQEG